MPFRHVQAQTTPEMAKVRDWQKGFMFIHNATCIKIVTLNGLLQKNCSMTLWEVCAINLKLQISAKIQPRSQSENITAGKVQMGKLL